MGPDLTITAKRYAPELAPDWDAFVDRSKNGTFLLKRGFMDYHADRFTDHSLVVTEDDAIIALLPANQDGDVLKSHGGLTYGGLVTGDSMTAARALEVFDAITKYLKDDGISALHYKPIPHFYHRQPAEEDLYALFRAGAEITRVDISGSIPIQRRLKFSKSKKHGAKAAVKAGFRVEKSDDWAACWDLLTQVLGDRHDAQPTHSLEEIKLLAGKFPENISLYGAMSGDTMVASLVIFDCGPAIHVQYIASSEEGRANGAVDLIVHTLLEEVFNDREWFDFGISTTNAGRELNAGLSRQKEMFGARTTTYQQYLLRL